MRSLLLISFLFLLATGCVPIKPKGLTPVDTGTRDAGQVRDTAYGSKEGRKGAYFVTRHPSRVTLYKATLDIKKHHLTGLLVIKRMDSASAKGIAAQEDSPVYRIVFANEIGMTFFDLELKYDSFNVISCFESLNKRALMKIFETDFRLLTGTDTLKSTKYYKQTGTGNLVIEGNSGKYKTWQTFSPSGDTLYKYSGKSTIADPVIISYLKYSEGFPTKITLENPFIGMTLSLRLLDQK